MHLAVVAGMMCGKFILARSGSMVMIMVLLLGLDYWFHQCCVQPTLATSMARFLRVLSCSMMVSCGRLVLSIFVRIFKYDNYFIVNREVEDFGLFGLLFCYGITMVTKYAANSNNL